LGGLEIINRLRPIAFTWKQGGMRGIGLAAEEQNSKGTRAAAPAV
jgi:hypothetical protein